MLRFSILFALGALGFHQLAWLPDWWWLGVEIALLLLVGLRSFLHPVAALLIGFTWSHAYALATLPPYLPDDGKPLRLVVQGRILSLPDRSRNPSRFVFEARSVEGMDERLSERWRLRLSWRDPPAIAVGQHWRLPVKLRAVHGYASPGTWDYEGWLYWQGVRYQGYVTEGDETRLLPDEPCCGLTRVRAIISSAIEDVPASPFARGVMRALTVGDQSGLSAETKALFRATGTSHLMAISGLHIGLLAGLGLFAVSWSWRRLPLFCGRIPARLAGAVAGLVAATIYALLAGMGLPTQRALVMLIVFTLSMLLRQAHSTAHALAAAALIVLLWHPPSIISAGFWLSFGAVLAILWILRWSAGRPVWYQAIQVQLGICLALWPVLAAFDMPASAVAPVVNLVLVPLFGLVVVPLSLLGASMLLVAPAPGAWILGHLGQLLDWIQYVLEFSAGLPFPYPAPAGLGAPEIMVLLSAVMLVISPPGIPMRWLAAPLLGIIWLPRAAGLSIGDFEVHLLDVGQGLSVVVETHTHTLVFDTGPEYPSGFSTAEAVVEPFLVQRGTHRVDRLVLSHGDRDHAGGVSHLRSNLDVVRIQSGEPDRVGETAVPCLAGETWQWDGVAFEYLHPAPDSALSGNDASCVLRVSNPAGTVLLTGDIGTAVENHLVAAMPDKLKSYAVVVPHHGSRSSSDAVFVAATSPVYALYATGWANRYGFPAEPVAGRWRAVGATGLDTASVGTISLKFAADGRIMAPITYRDEYKRFWWHDSGSARAVHAVSSGD